MAVLGAGLDHGAGTRNVGILHVTKCNGLTVNWLNFKFTGKIDLSTGP